VDATRVETATLAAKIRKLAMYAQQLAETGIKAEGRSGGRSGDGNMAAKIRKLAMYAQQLADTGMKGDQVDALRVGWPHGGQDQEAGYVRPAAG